MKAYSRTSLRALACLAAILACSAACAESSASNATLSLLSGAKTTKVFAANKAVSEALIKQILAAGANAQSAMNKQPWYFSAVMSGTLRNEIKELARKSMKGGPGKPGEQGGPGAPDASRPDAPPEAMPKDMTKDAASNQPPEAPKDDKAGPGDRDPLDGAPVAIVISGTKNWRWSTIDCSIACEAMIVAAQSLGLGAHVVAGPAEAIAGPDGATLRKKLKIDSSLEPVLVLLVGYPEDAADAASKASTRLTGNWTIVK
jgi:Nitroreductase